MTYLRAQTWGHHLLNLGQLKSHDPILAFRHDDDIWSDSHGRTVDIAKRVS